MNITKPNQANILHWLKGFPNWVCWKLKKRGDKWTKPPLNPKTGKDAKVNDPKTWSDFETAWAAYEQKNYDGIGIVLTKKMGIAGFDFDHCIDESGNLDKKVLRYIQSLDSYTEISPSGTGIRIFAFGSLPPGRRKKGPYEVYSHGRYLTLTGNIFEEKKEIYHREEGIKSVYAEIFGESEVAKSDPVSDSPKPKPLNEDRLEKAFKSKCGSEIRSLYSGNWSEAGFPSQSEADLKFAKHLAFWFDRNAGEMDRIFRSSGLMREKWDRKIGNKTYGEMTLEQAISHTTNTYGEFISSLEPSEKKKMTAAEWIKHLNEKHAVVMVRGKFCILNEETDPVTLRPDISFSSKDDFINRYTTKYVVNPNDGNTTTAGKLWFHSPKRRSYNGIVFSPGEKPEGYYNLWRGFGLEPKQGCWERMRQHIWENICSENPEYFKWFTAWFANMLQNPGKEQPGTAIILRGGKGTGKSIFINQFKYILNNHFLAVSNQRHITGNFNYHLKDVLLLCCNEGFWGGNKVDDSVLKHMITESSIFIEGKGKDGYSVESHLFIVMISNELWVVNASTDERRYFSLEVGTKHQQDKEYFGAIWKEMNEGGREAMMYDLLNLDISEVDLKTAPKTEGLLKQIEKSMNPAEQWWWECLNFERNTSDGWWSETVSCEELYMNYQKFVSDIGAKGYRMTHVQFGKQLKELCPDLTRTRQNIGGNRVWSYRFPQINVCKQIFEDKIGMKIDWEKPEEDLA
jgi:hypothetical protein